MNQLGLKKTLTLAMVLITALAVGISNYFNYQSISSVFKQKVYSNTRGQVQSERDILASFIADKARVVDRIAKDYGQYRYPERHAEHMRIAATAGDIANLTVGFPNGDAYCSADTPGWVNHKNPPTYDATKRPWFNQALNASGLIYTEPYEDATTKELMVSIGEKTGHGAVVLADIPLTVLKQAVQSFTMKGSIALIVDQNAIVLASTSSIIKPGDNASEHREFSSVIKQIKGNDSTTMDYTLNGIEKVLFAEKIHYGENDWYLMVGLDKDVVFADVNQIKTQAIILTIVCVLLSVIVTTVILNLLYRPIIALKNTIFGLSSGNGDLTQRLIVNSHDDLGQISGGVNKFIEQLQSLMLQVEQVASELETNATELKSASDENARVLNQHAQETEQIATAVEEMSATANTVAQNASESSQSTQEVSNIGERSIQVLQTATDRVSQLVDDVGKTSQSMKLMTDETSNISNILSVIGDIAAQTNLLALNAAIEAARAGEQGRGFAVVADEVRALASRTQSSTEEIEDALERLLAGNTKVVALMDSTQKTSQETYEGTEEVSQTLNELMNQVMTIKDLSIQIATAAEEQSSVTEEVNQNMSALNDIVVKLNANGERVVGQASDISDRNKKLVSIVHQFKLK